MSKLQVIEFANHFQKHSDLSVVRGKPLIDHALPASYKEKTQSSRDGTETEFGAVDPNRGPSPELQRS
jgi:hypothetical protein